MLPQIVHWIKNGGRLNPQSSVLSMTHNVNNYEQTCYNFYIFSGIQMCDAMIHLPELI